MTKKRTRAILLFPLLLFFSMMACDERQQKLQLQPVLSTDEPGTPEAQYVTLRATIDPDQVSLLNRATTSFGFAWSTHPDNTLENSTVISYDAPLEDDHFNASIYDLQSDTRYFVRAFMEVDQQVFYGNEVSFTTRPGTWRRLADFPGDGFTHSTAFTLGGLAFVVAGGAVWSYNPVSDHWTQKNNFPVTTKGPTSFVVGERAYVYCGTLYEYSIHGDSWSAIANTDETSQRGCDGVGSFVIDGTAYIGAGHGNFNEGFISYDPATGKWGKMEFYYKVPNVGYAAVFAVNNIGYVVCGEERSGEYLSSNLLTYDVRESTWERYVFKNPSGFERKRAHMLSFVINDKAFLGYGTGGTSDFYHLNDLTKSTEVQSTALTYDGEVIYRPSRNGGVAFSIGNKGYVGLGTSTKNEEIVLLRDMWEFTPD